jgi:hypothetical protein
VSCAAPQMAALGRTQIEARFWLSRDGTGKRRSAINYLYTRLRWLLAITATRFYRRGSNSGAVTRESSHGAREATRPTVLRLATAAFRNGRGESEALMVLGRTLDALMWR